MQSLHAVKDTLLHVHPKRIMLSGPSGFLGSNVLQAILEVHQIRKSHGVDPGELILLSGSPGKLMQSLYKRYGAERMDTVRATRVDYYRQHDVDTWTDQLGSLGKHESPIIMYLTLLWHVIFICVKICRSRR